MPGAFVMNSAVGKGTTQNLCSERCFSAAMALWWQLSPQMRLSLDHGWASLPRLAALRETGCHSPISCLHRITCALGDVLGPRSVVCSRRGIPAVTAAQLYTCFPPSPDLENRSSWSKLSAFGANGTHSPSKTMTPLLRTDSYSPRSAISPVISTK